MICALCFVGHPFHTEGLTCLAISNDSSIAITGSTDHNACLVNIQTGKVGYNELVSVLCSRSLTF